MRVDRDDLPAIGLGITQIMRHGSRMGWIASVAMAVNAAALVVFAWLAQAYGGWSGFFAKAFLRGCRISRLPQIRRSEESARP